MTHFSANIGEDLAQALRVLTSLTQKADEAPADPFHQQRLYEKWLGHENWLLRKEALPLLVGQNPEDWPTLLAPGEVQRAEEIAWKALKTSILHQGEPRILNSSSMEEDWRIQPAALIPWARSIGVEVPEYLQTLLQYILSVVKKPVEPPDGRKDQSAQLLHEGSTAQSQPQVREQVLGAALNVLAKCPGQCYDEHGLVSGKAIVQIIVQQSIRWFNAPKPPLNPGEMAALIDKWLE